MTDFATLVLGADATRLKEGAVALDQIATKAVTAEAKVTTANTGMMKSADQAAAALVRTSREMTAAGRASGAMTSGIQSAAFQVADFFVMVEGGISPMRALSTQLPQLLGSFGMWGAVIGGVVAAGSALVPMLFDSVSAVDRMTEANEAFADSFSALKDDISAATSLQSEYAAAVRSGNATVIAAIQQEAVIRQKLIDLDQIDLKAKASTAAAAAAASQQQMQAAQMVAAARQAELDGQIKSQAAAQKVIDTIQQQIDLAKASGDVAGSLLPLSQLDQAIANYQQISSEVDRVKVELTAQNAELQKQQDLHAKTSLEYQLIGAQIAANSGKLGAVNAILDAIQGGVTGVASGLSAAASNAYGLGSALQAAAGYAAGLRSTIEGVNFGNIALAAQNAALQAGSTVAAATAAGQYAEQQAKLAPMLGSQDAILRQAAQAELSRYKSTLDTNVALAAQNSALISAAGAANKAAGGGRAITEEISAADKAAQAFAESMSGKVQSAVEGTVDQMMDGFKGGLRGLLDSWEDTLKQMVGMAIKSKLTQYLFGGAGAAAGTAAAAASPAGALGAWGASGVGSGFMGGLQASMSGGLGGVFSAGANATAAGGTLMATLGAVALPLAAVAAAFSFLKTKTTELDAGLKVTVTGMGALVEQFSTTEKVKFWGLSKRTGTSITGADADTTYALNQALSAIQAGVMDAASSLGIASSAFDGFVYDLSVSTKGMTQDQAMAAVQAKFAQMGNAFALMVPNLHWLQKYGEGASDALARLANASQAVNAMADTLGLTFRSLNLYGAGLSASLADQFGGLDAMAQASSAYYQAFYSDAERTAILTRQTSAAMAALGLAMPRTREGFRALVQAQDLTTEAGRKAFAGLVSLSQAFAQVVPDSAEAAKAAAEAAQAATDAAKAEADQAAAAMQKMADAIESARGSISDYIADLTGTASELLSPQAALARARATYSQALASGDLSDVSGLTSAADAMLSGTRSAAGSAFEVARAQALVVAQLNAVAGGGLVATGSSAPVSSIAQIAASAPSVAAKVSDSAIETLRAELAGLRSLMAQIGAETITLNRRTSDSLQKWDRDGMPAVRT